LREGIVIDDCRRNAALILAQMIQDVSPYRRPRTDTAAPLTQPCVANNTSFYRMVAPRHQVAPQNFVYKVLFGLTFHMNQQSRHCG
jgi:hypothetical protein